MSHVDPEALLAHADWVRSLARSLVQDPHRAADVEQDSWLEALRHPPRHASNLRAWLARIVRSSALRSARSGARRERREAATVVPEAQPSVDDVVSQAERQRELAGRVLALEEPFRTVILLRYFQGKPPREIARQLDRPLNTVRSQLQRGLDRLRRELDGEYGDRGAWCALLLPLAGPGSLVMGTNVKIGVMVSAAAIAAVVIGVWRSGPTRTEVVETVEEPPVAIEPAAFVGDEPEPASSTKRQSVELAPAATAVEEPGFVLVGRTVNLLARPLGGVGLLCCPDDEALEVVSDVEGGFRIEHAHTHRTVAVTDPDRVKVASGWVDGELWVIVAAAVPMEGRVVGPDGLPVGAASVKVVVNAMSLRDFDRTPDWERAFEWLTGKSDAEGHFLLPRVPVVSDRWEADTFVSAEGYETAHPPLPTATGEFVEVVLEPLGAERPRQVTGIVRAPRGVPVAGAEVFYGWQTARTDEDGRFVLPAPDVYEDMALRAIHPDYTVGRVDGFGEMLLADEADVDGVVVVLGPAPRSIRGRIVDEHGAEGSAFRVTLQDGTPLAATGDWAELRPFTGVDTPVIPDDEGRFVIPGLGDRDYRLRVWDATTGLVIVTDPVPAGTDDLVVRIPSEATEHLVGFAVDRHGKPVPDLVVYVAFQETPSVYQGWRTLRQEATTDAEGRFEVPAMPREHARLSFDGALTLGGYHEVPPHTDGEPVTIAIPMLTRFRVELEPGDPADGFELLTTAGTIQRLSEFHSWGSRVESKVERTEDGFPVCVCPDDVAMIVLYEGDSELRRVPITLPPGGVHVVRP